MADESPATPAPDNLKVEDVGQADNNNKAGGNDHKSLSGDDVQTEKVSSAKDEDTTVDNDDGGDNTATNKGGNKAPDATMAALPAMTTLINPLTGQPVPALASPYAQAALPHGAIATNGQPIPMTAGYLPHQLMHPIPAPGMLPIAPAATATTAAAAAAAAAGAAGAGRGTRPHPNAAALAAAHAAVTAAMAAGAPTTPVILSPGGTPAPGVAGATAAPLPIAPVPTTTVTTTTPTETGGASGTTETSGGSTTPLVGETPILPAAAAAASVAAAAVAKVKTKFENDSYSKLKTPRRCCRFPGCTKTIKSQGHCQKHGARAKRCKVEGCPKQAQGTHDGMCKRHWKAINNPKPPPKPEDLPPDPVGSSVYDYIIPASIAWKATKKRIDDRDVMPLVSHLSEYADQPAGWHRNEERASRGKRPVTTASAQFEPWERQLVMFEIMLVSGTMYSSHRNLAHAWGREKGFHSVLVNQVCERRGELERKKRSDTGRLYSEEQKASFKVKLHRARHEKKAREEREGGATGILGHSTGRTPTPATTTVGANVNAIPGLPMIPTAPGLTAMPVGANLAPPGTMPMTLAHPGAGAVFASPTPGTMLVPMMPMQPPAAPPALPAPPTDVTTKQETASPSPKRTKIEDVGKEETTLKVGANTIGVEVATPQEPAAMPPPSIEEMVQENTEGEGGDRASENDVG